MKTALLFVTLCTLCSCYSGKELQADVMNAQLVKIDTIYRYPNIREQVLTWKCSTGVEYTSIDKLRNVYTLGSTMKVLVRK